MFYSDHRIWRTARNSLGSFTKIPGSSLVYLSVAMVSLFFRVDAVAQSTQWRITKIEGSGAMVLLGPSWRQAPRDTIGRQIEPGDRMMLSRGKFLVVEVAAGETKRTLVMGHTTTQSGDRRGRFDRKQDVLSIREGVAVVRGEGQQMELFADTDDSYTFTIGSEVVVVADSAENQSCIYFHSGNSVTFEDGRIPEGTHGFPLAVKGIAELHGTGPAASESPEEEDQFCGEQYPWFSQTASQYLKMIRPWYASVLAPQVLVPVGAALGGGALLFIISGGPDDPPLPLTGTITIPVPGRN